MRALLERIVIYSGLGFLVVLALAFVGWVGATILHWLDDVALHFFGGIQ